MIYLMPFLIGTIARQSAFGDFYELISDPSERTYLPASQTDFDGFIEGSRDYLFVTSPPMGDLTFSLYTTKAGLAGAGIGYQIKAFGTGINVMYDSVQTIYTAGLSYESRKVRIDASFYIKDTAKALLRVKWNAMEQGSVNLLAGNINSSIVALSIAYEPTSLTFLHMGMGYLKDQPYLFSMVEFPILRNFVFLRGSFQQGLKSMERRINFGASLRIDNLSVDYLLDTGSGSRLDLQYRFKIF